jgi:integrase
MARPAGNKVFTRQMTFEGYFALINSLDEKIAKTSLLKNKSVKLELNKLEAIKAVITILIFTGLRISETRLITIGDIRKAIKYLSFVVYEQKKKKYRKVEISKTGAKAFKLVFKKYLDEISDNNLVIRRYKRIQTPYSPNYLQNMINNYIHSVLGEEYTSHSFRRLVITEVIKTHGVEYAKAVANHSKIETTFIYKNRPEEGSMGEALEAMWKNRK